MTSAAEEKVKCVLCAQLWPWEQTDLDERLTQAQRVYPYYPWDIVWACGDCVRCGYAEPADPSKQNFGGLGSPPFLSYWDQTRPCGYCGEDYLFTMGEQRFWFEILGAHVQAHPKGCRQCRRFFVNRKNAQKELLQRKCRPVDTADWKALAELAELTLAAGGFRKGLQLLGQAKNRCEDHQARETLVNRIKETQLAGPQTTPCARFISRVGDLDQVEWRYWLSPNDFWKRPTFPYRDHHRANHADTLEGR